MVVGNYNLVVKGWRRVVGKSEGVRVRSDRLDR